MRRGFSPRARSRRWARLCGARGRRCSQAARRAAMHGCGDDMVEIVDSSGAARSAESSKSDGESTLRARLVGERSAPRHACRRFPDRARPGHSERAPRWITSSKRRPSSASRASCRSRANGSVGDGTRAGQSRTLAASCEKRGTTVRAFGTFPSSRRRNLVRGVAARSLLRLRSRPACRGKSRKPIPLRDRSTGAHARQGSQSDRRDRPRRWPFS